MNVSLTSELEAFVSEQVEGGRYRSASEVVRHALRLLLEQEEQKRAKIEALRQAVQAGIDSGEPVAWDLEELLNRVREKSA